MTRRFTARVRQPLLILSLRVSECADAISAWMKCNRLQLNPDKTEVLWCATGRRQHQLPTSAVLIAGVLFTPAPALFVRDLGIYIDTDLSMRIHIQRTVSCCFAVLRQLRQIRRCVPATTFQMLVVARGALPAGLRQQRAGRHPSLPLVPTRRHG